MTNYVRITEEVAVADRSPRTARDSLTRSVEIGEKWDPDMHHCFVAMSDISNRRDRAPLSSSSNSPCRLERHLKTKCFADGTVEGLHRHEQIERSILHQPMWHRSMRITMDDQTKIDAVQAQRSITSANIPVTRDRAENQTQVSDLNPGT